MKLILEDITKALEQIEPEVYYGMAPEYKGGELWNYIVFNRSTLQSSQNKTGLSDYFRVAIVKENYIPEGEPEKVIEALTSIPGMRLTSTPGEYEYARKTSTGAVVEMLVLEFVKARKNG